MGSAKSTNNFKLTPKSLLLQAQARGAGSTCPRLPPYAERSSLPSHCTALPSRRHPQRPPPDPPPSHRAPREGPYPPQRGPSGSCGRQGRARRAEHDRPAAARHKAQIARNRWRRAALQRTRAEQDPEATAGNSKSAPSAGAAPSGQTFSSTAVYTRSALQDDLYKHRAENLCF